MLRDPCGRENSTKKRASFALEVEFLEILSAVLESMPDFCFILLWARLERPTSAIQ
jgi:hypothetical protein